MTASWVASSDPAGPPVCRGSLLPLVAPRGNASLGDALAALEPPLRSGASLRQRFRLQDGRTEPCLLRVVTRSL